MELERINTHCAVNREFFSCSRASPLEPNPDKLDGFDAISIEFASEGY